MHIHIVGLHAPNAPRLAALLGDRHVVTGLRDFDAPQAFDADVIVSNRVDANEAARLRSRLLQVPGAGCEQIALPALPGGCAVANVHGHEVPIAEFTLHAILEHVLQPWKYPAVLDADAWSRSYAGRALHQEAAGSTLTLVGFGHIGREVARRARAMDMRIVAVTRGGNLGAEAGVDESVMVTQLHTVLPRTDVLVLCCPLTDETRGLIGREALALLPEGALLINVARAEVADEAALFDALESGRLGRAALDVWYRYPQADGVPVTPSRLPFHTLRNVRATPHISAMTPGLLARRYAFIASNIERLAQGKPLLNVVRPSFDTPSGTPG
ncbi:MAG: 2-hydroxyacid dehydrogenase [Achromobacter sp.]